MASCGEIRIEDFLFAGFFGAIKLLLRRTLVRFVLYSAFATLKLIGNFFLAEAQFPRAPG